MGVKGSYYWFLINRLADKSRFLNPFLQLAAEKKDSKNGAARKFCGPSYFDPTLVEFMKDKNPSNVTCALLVVRKKTSLEQHMDSVHTAVLSQIPMYFTLTQNTHKCKIRVNKLNIIKFLILERKLILIYDFGVVQKLC